MNNFRDQIEIAEQFLRAGRTVGIPTETVYGLAGNALDPAALTEIFRIKNRPSFDPLIVHLAGAEELEKYAAEIPEIARRLADAFWPGPLTLLLPRRLLIPNLVTAGLPRAAFRVPDHRPALELLARLDFPLAAPSANPFGYVSPTTAAHVLRQLGEKIPYVLDAGPCRIGLESTIVGFEPDGPTVFRLGGLSVEKIEALAGPVKIRLNQSSDPRAPGMLKLHYAPDKKVILGDIRENHQKLAGRPLSILSFQNKFADLPAEAHYVLSATGQIEEAARNLFAALRLSDSDSADCLLAESLPESGLGRAINDRLRRAAFRE